MGCRNIDASMIARVAVPETFGPSTPRDADIGEPEMILAVDPEITTAQGRELARSGNVGDANSLNMANCRFCTCQLRQKKEWKQDTAKRFHAGTFSNLIPTALWADFFRPLPGCD